MDKHQTNLFAFLVGNMKDMEIELRAQSIVLEALVSKVITVDDLGDALNWARKSSDMLRLIETKYRLCDEQVINESTWHAVHLTKPPSKLN